MEFSDVIRKRYSVRKFEQRPVEQSALDAVLQAGLLAPTAKNLQPQRILVIRRQEDLEKLDRCTRCRFGAPCALLVMGYPAPDAQPSAMHFQTLPEERLVFFDRFPE